MRGGGCGERDEGIVGKGMRGGDFRERDEGRGLWGKGCMRGGEGGGD